MWDFSSTTSRYCGDSKEDHHHHHNDGGVDGSLSSVDTFLVFVQL